jgi:hypothetical protein
VLQGAGRAPAGAGDADTMTRTSALLLLAPLTLALGLAACDKAAPEIAPDPRPKPAAAPPEPEPEDLVKEDVKVGAGPEAKSGDKVRVHYTGKLRSGAQFDSSVGKQPFEFTLGEGGVIKGWDLGVVGMKVGGKRKLTIPSRLGYGDTGSPPKIPGKSTLVFDVELLEIVGAAPAASGSAKADKPKK